jgi:hypothetical protein
MWALAFAAAAPAQDIAISPDVSVDLSGTVLDDEDVGADLGSAGVVPEVLGNPSTHTNVNAYHALPNGDKLMSFNTTVELPGGLRAEPRDVILWDGSSHFVDWDGAAAGVPDGAVVDAVVEISGALVVSFDTSVDLGGVFADDEDLVDVAGAGASILFDGSAAGVVSSLDLDGASVLPNGNLALSFDGSGDVGAGFAFDDEDVLEYESASGAWSLLYDASAAHAGAANADVDAVHVVPEPGQLSSLATGLTFLWTTSQLRNRRRMKR